MVWVVGDAAAFKVLSLGLHTFTPLDGHFINCILVSLSWNPSEDCPDCLLKFLDRPVAGSSHLCLCKGEGPKIARSQIWGVCRMTE